MGSSIAEELERIVAALQAESDLDERGKEIRAGAVTLLGTPSSVQRDVLKSMCKPWGVLRRESGKERRAADVRRDLQQTVVDAWRQWQEMTGRGPQKHGVGASSSSSSGGPTGGGAEDVGQAVGFSTSCAGASAGGPDARGTDQRDDPMGAEQPRNRSRSPRTSGGSASGTHRQCLRAYSRRRLTDSLVGSDEQRIHRDDAREKSGGPPRVDRYQRQALRADSRRRHTDNAWVPTEKPGVCLHRR